MRDVAKRADLPDVLPRGLYRGVSLRPDGSGFYYAAQSRQTGIRIRYHALGTPPGQDVEVFGERLRARASGSARTSPRTAGSLLLAVQHGWARNEIFVQDARRRRGPSARSSRTSRRTSAPEFAGDRLIVQTDWKAPRWRIVEVDLADPTPERWREIVPEGPDAIQDFVPVGGKLIVHYLHDVASRLRALLARGHGRWGARPARPRQRELVPGSLDRRRALLRLLVLHDAACDLPCRCADAQGRALVAAEVPFDPSAYETKQVWYASKDGTKVPMFVTHRQGLVLDGRRPTLLYGYGGLQRQPPARLQPCRGLVDRAGRRLRRAQPARGRRVRRGVAPRGHAREEAERLRRLHRRRGVADRGNRYTEPEPPRDPRRQQRRPARGRRPHAAARAVPRGPLRLPGPRHDRVPPLREQQPARPSSSTATPRSPTSSSSSSPTRRTRR